jgi:hypothetical protein
VLADSALGLFVQLVLGIRINQLLHLVAGEPARGLLTQRDQPPRQATSRSKYTSG